MVHLWQYSGNAWIATCSKPLDAALYELGVSEEVSPSLRLFEGTLLSALYGDVIIKNYNRVYIIIFQEK